MNQKGTTMDPNETLRRIRELVAGVNAQRDNNGDNGDFGSEAIETLCTLVDNVDALDQWIATGGFPPDGWKRTPRDHTYVARRVPIRLESPDGRWTYNLDVLVNDWSDGTSSVALQQSLIGQWGPPAPLVEEPT